MPPPPLLLVPRNDNVAADLTVGQMLIECARRTPSRTVLADSAHGAPARRWTCEALRDDAAILATALLSRFDPGERIALWAPACADAALLQFAAAFAGLPLVVFDEDWPLGDVVRRLADSRATALFVSAGAGDGDVRRRVAAAGADLREIVDLSDRRALFAKRRCVDGLPEIRAGDLAQIRYAPEPSGAGLAVSVSQAELALRLRPALAGFSPAAARRRTRSAAFA